MSGPGAPDEPVTPGTAAGRRAAERARRDRLRYGGSQSTESEQTDRLDTENRIRRLLRNEPRIIKFIKWVGTDTPSEIRRKVGLWLPYDAASQAVEEVLQYYAKYRTIGPLTEDLFTAEATPPLETGGHPEVETRPFLEAARDLPTDELVTVANALLREARVRQQHEAEERYVARDDALEKINGLTQLADETKRRLEGEILRAKANGATWTAIGEAANIRRDVAYKRWSRLLPQSKDDDDPPTPSVLVERP